MPNTHLFRVKPNEELLTAIKTFCEKNKIRSGVITQIIGSFSSVKLNFLKSLPGNYITKEFKSPHGPLEIVAGQGTIATMADTNELVLHIHILVSDENKAVGGHLTEGIIFSTAEVFIQELDYPIKRKMDSYTGLKEITD
ncbi:MAG: DNA-binding protein [Candidatus Aenigmarchaeota archaeon]|nr:DNA-binding protein [Candidatus Aenigmarchaeota archaeon]